MVYFIKSNRTPPRSTPFPYTTLFRSQPRAEQAQDRAGQEVEVTVEDKAVDVHGRRAEEREPQGGERDAEQLDRKSTRLNSSHLVISYAVFCLKKKRKNKMRVY